MAIINGNSVLFSPVGTKVKVNGEFQSEWNADLKADKTEIEAKANKTDLDTKVSKTELVDIVYPIGSIYLSTSITSPANLFGGTWEQIADGRVLMGTTDSSKLNTTVEAGLPNIKGVFGGMPTGGAVNASGAFTYSNSGSHNTWGSSAAPRTNYTFDASTYNSIYSDAINTVQPPALYVYMWQRVA